MIYNIELVLFVLTGIEVIFCAPSCKPNQKMRQDISGKQICCYTVTCELGQKFSFCKQDQGHDICTSCPEGTYHLDKIDTAIMDITFDPCVPKPTCEQPEVTLVNGECVCDRSQAYYGHDINNCFLAEVMCSSPGFELKNDGTCGPCDKEYFKSEASAEHVCRKKTICFDSQEVYSNGSKTTDRTCKAKHPSLRGIQASKHEIENNNNNTSYIFAAQKEQTSTSNSLTLALVITALVVITMIIVVFKIIGKSMYKDVKRTRYKYPDSEKQSRNENEKCIVHNAASLDSDEYLCETQDMVTKVIDESDSGYTYGQSHRILTIKHSNHISPNLGISDKSSILNDISPNRIGDLTESPEGNTTSDSDTRATENNTVENVPHDKNANEGSIPYVECYRRGSMNGKETCETLQENSNKKNKMLDAEIKNNAKDSGDKEINKTLEIHAGDAATMLIHKCDPSTETLTVNNRHMVTQTEIMNLNTSVNGSDKTCLNIVNNAIVPNTDINCIITKSAENTQINVTNENTKENGAKRRTLSNINQNLVDNKKRQNNEKYIRRENENGVIDEKENKNIFVKRKDTEKRGSNLILNTTKKDENTQTSINDGIKIIENESVPDYTEKRRRDYLNYIHRSANVNNHTNQTDPKVKDTEETYVKEIGEKEMDNYSTEIYVSEITVCSRSKVAKVRPIMNSQQDSERSSSTTDEQNSSISNPENPHTSWKVATSYASRPADSAIRREEAED